MFQKEKLVNFVIVVIAVAGGFYFTFYFKSNTKPNPSPSYSPMPTPNVGAKLENMSANDLDSGGFPAIAIPSGVLDKSLKATSPEGRVQLTKIYKSTDSVESNYNYLRSLLIQEGNGWTVISKVDDPNDPNRKALFATDAKGTLNINISKSDNPGFNSMIDLSYLPN